MIFLHTPCKKSLRSGHVSLNRSTREFDELGVLRSQLGSQVPCHSHRIRRISGFEVRSRPAALIIESLRQILALIEAWPLMVCSTKSSSVVHARTTNASSFIYRSTTLSSLERQQNGRMTMIERSVSDACNPILQRTLNFNLNPKRIQSPQNPPSHPPVTPTRHNSRHILAILLSLMHHFSDKVRKARGGFVSRGKGSGSDRWHLRAIV